MGALRCLCVYGLKVLALNLGLDWMLHCDSGDWLHCPPGQPPGDLEPGWDTSGEVCRHLASSQVELGSVQFTRLTETLSN